MDGSTATATEQDTFLDAAEAVAYLSDKYRKPYKVSTILKYARLGQAPGLKVGASWVFPQRLLDAWILGRWKPTPQEAVS